MKLNKSNLHAILQKLEQEIMPINLYFYEASHRYGLDLMAQTPAQIALANSILGSQTDATASWSGYLYPGETGTISQYLSGGYRLDMTVFYASVGNISVTKSSMFHNTTQELLFEAFGEIKFSSTGKLIEEQAAVAYAGNDTMTGNSHNNIFRGYGGNDVINGGLGIDTAYFSGKKGSYQITQNGNLTTVVGVDGADTLISVERLQFEDLAVALDTANAGGQAYRLYQAAFNRKPDKVGLGFQINAMERSSIDSVAKNFIDSPEFFATYGKLTNTAFVTQLYANVLHRSPDSGGLAYHVGNLDSGANSKAEILVGFSESPENQASLIGTIQNGMEYIAYL